MKCYRFFFFVLSLPSVLSCGHTSSHKLTRADHKPGPIDSLASSRQVEAFVRKQDTLLKHFRLRPVSDYQGARFLYDKKILFDQVRRVKPPLFVRGDFDNNGYTDLLVSGDPRRGCEDTLSVCGFESILFLQSAKGTKSLP